MKLPRTVRTSAGASYVRNFVFGVEDSLVSTVGLVSGIAVVDVERKTILVTGLVLIFVEAFSMSMGAILAESSAEEYLRQRTTKLRRPVLDGVIMFFSYFISGFVPLAPYTFLQSNVALWVSIGASLLALVLLGYFGAHLSKTSILRSMMRTVLIGGVAIVIGIVVGQLASR